MDIQVAITCTSAQLMPSLATTITTARELLLTQLEHLMLDALFTDIQAAITCTSVQLMLSLATTITTAQELLLIQLAHLTLDALFMDIQVAITCTSAQLMPSLATTIITAQELLLTQLAHLTLDALFTDILVTIPMDTITETHHMSRALNITLHTKCAVIPCSKATILLPTISILKFNYYDYSSNLCNLVLTRV